MLFNSVNAGEAKVVKEILKGFRSKEFRVKLFERVYTQLIGMVGNEEEIEGLVEVAIECIGMEGQAGEAGVRLGLECMRWEEGVEWAVDWVEVRDGEEQLK